MNSQHAALPPLEKADLADIGAELAAEEAVVLKCLEQCLAIHPCSAVSASSPRACLSAILNKQRKVSLTRCAHHSECMPFSAQAQATAKAKDKAHEDAEIAHAHTCVCARVVQVCKREQKEKRAGRWEGGWKGMKEAERESARRPRRLRV